MIRSNGSTDVFIPVNELTINNAENGVACKAETNKGRCWETFGIAKIFDPLPSVKYRNLVYSLNLLLKIK